VSAVVHGLRDGDPVRLVYSTADGQTVDRTVEMALASGGLRYECKLPAKGQESGVGSRESAGIQQDLTYHIVAGDAQSADYKLTVVAAPTIIVEKLDYQFPAYTKKPPLSTPRQGDIHALEGTRVTIHAVANQPIKSAYLELDPGVKDVPPELAPLAVDGTRASGTLVLALKADRKTPWHASYQVRFYTDRGQRSQQPILHKIEVIRDLPPEVQILQPQKVRVEVPLDGEQMVEVRGVDPDFGLSSLRLEGSLQGVRALEVELLDGKSGQAPQATVPFVFRPAGHKLAVGDELTYTAIAADNRQPEANISRTAEYTLVVVAPRGGEGARGQESGDSSQKPDGGKPEGTQARSASEGAQPAKPENTPTRSVSEGAPPTRPENGSGESRQPMPGASGSKPENGASQSGQPNQAQPDKSQPQSGDQQGNNAGSQGSAASKPQEDASGSQNQGGSSSPGGASGSQAGSPQGASPMSEDGQPAGANPGAASGQPSGNSQSPSGQQGDAPADGSGTPSGSGGKPEKAHEGQLVEELLRQAQQEQGTGSKGQGTGDSGQESGDRGQESGVGSQESGNTQARSASEGAPQSSGDQQASGNQQASGGQQASGDQQSAGNPKPGAPSEGARPTNSQTPGSQPQPGQSSSGQQTGDSSSTGQPGASDQKPQPGQGSKTPGEKTNPPDRLPGENQGQNPSQQPGNNSAGGAPQGASKTDQGQQSPMGQGEKRDPGAGQNGQEGAGTKSADKTGSGAGQETNQDRPKSQQPNPGSAETGEPSPPSGSKRQSDSQGGQSGDQSGGGKQGAGQSAGQEGQDSAGSKSAADQGAGAANQTGSGQTGSKAGGKEQAPGQTGQSGNEKGQGTQARSASEGEAGSAGKSGSRPEGEAGNSDSKSKSDSAGNSGKSAGGPIEGGGGDGNRPQVDYGPSKEIEAGEAANLEYSRKATDLALQKLRDQQHDPDPALLEKLGWSKDDLAEFLRRWEGLKKSAAESADGKRELDEALKSLGLSDPANRKRTGSTTSDHDRDLRDAGSRTAPPPKYRDLFDAFRKGAARSGK
jgi:hypothetical protein